MDDLLTVADIARILKLNQQTVRNWITADMLPAIRIGRGVRITRADFQRFLDAGYSGSSRSQTRGADASGFWNGAELPAPELPADR